MAEGPYTTTSRGTSDAIRRDTVGWPNFTQDSFKIVDAGDERELPDGQTGLLLYRGPSTLAGYFDAPEHNAVAIRPGGYFDTGDLAKVVRIDGQRCLSIEGRTKDVISRGGEKINTEEVEKLLLKHESIIEAAVVAMPDKRLGERACAYISLADGVSALPLDEIK
jgi:2,3-dihydroxybenzoate-AMP ligase